MAAHGRVIEPTTPDIVAAILEVDSESALSDAATRLGVSTTQLAAWRTAFLDGGIQALARCNPWRWHQFNLTLTANSSQYLRLVEGRLGPTVTRWLDSGLLDAFFYLHKPPGIRWRFLPAPGAELGQQLTDLMDRVVDDHGGAAWSRGVYSPEVHLFGGIAGMELAHRFFTADSEAWLTYYRGRVAGRIRLSVAEFSAVLLDQCFRTAGLDRWERWDVWLRLARVDRLDADDDAIAAIDARQLCIAAEAIAACFADDIGLAYADAHDAGECVRTYRARLAPLAPDIDRLQREGGLVIHLREAVPHWVAFHWNRAGFGLEQQRRLAGVIARILNPHPKRDQR